jgi:hypothetical protein
LFDVHCHFVPPDTPAYLAASPHVELTERGVVRGPAVLPLPPRLSAGEPDHRDSYRTPADRACGDIILVCVSRSRSPRLVLDL